MKRISAEISPPKTNFEGFKYDTRFIYRMDSMTVDPDVILATANYEPEQLATALLNHHYARLHFLAYSLLGDADDADDAVQAVIIRAIDRIDRYRPGSNLHAWLSKMTVNQCRDMRRKHAVRQRLVDGLGKLMRGKPPTKSPEKQTEQQETQSDLWKMVNALGDKHRQPLILRYVHSMSVPEIAELLGVRQGTIYSRLHYACRQLGRQLTLQDRDDLMKGVLNE